MPTAVAANIIKGMPVGRAIGVVRILPFVAALVTARAYAQSDVVGCAPGTDTDSGAVIIEEPGTTFIKCQPATGQYDVFIAVPFGTTEMSQALAMAKSWLQDQGATFDDSRDVVHAYCYDPRDPRPSGYVAEADCPSAQPISPDAGLAPRLERLLGWQPDFYAPLGQPSAEPPVVAVVFANYLDTRCSSLGTPSGPCLGVVTLGSTPQSSWVVFAKDMPFLQVDSLAVDGQRILLRGSTGMHPIAMDAQYLYVGSGQAAEVRCLSVTEVRTGQTSSCR